VGRIAVLLFAASALFSASCGGDSDEHATSPTAAPTEVVTPSPTASPVPVLPGASRLGVSPEAAQALAKLGLKDAEKTQEVLNVQSEIRNATQAYLIYLGTNETAATARSFAEAFNGRSFGKLACADASNADLTLAWVTANAAAANVAAAASTEANQFRVADKLLAPCDNPAMNAQLDYQRLVDRFASEPVEVPTISPSYEEVVAGTEAAFANLGLERSHGGVIDTLGRCNAPPFAAKESGYFARFVLFLCSDAAGWLVDLYRVRGSDSVLSALGLLEAFTYSKLRAFVAEGALAEPESELYWLILQKGWFTP